MVICRDCQSRIIRNKCPKCDYLCPNCTSTMVRNGSRYRCLKCLPGLCLYCQKPYSVVEHGEDSWSYECVPCDTLVNTPLSSEEIIQYSKLIQECSFWVSRAGGRSAEENNRDKELCEWVLKHGNDLRSILWKRVLTYCENRSELNGKVCGKEEAESQ